MGDVKGKVRIVLADDHTLVRDGLRRVIEAEPDFKVIGEAATVAATVEEVARAHPDILLLDVSMPGGGGIAALKEIRKTSAGTRILVLTMHEDPEYLRVALVSGASGFLLKHAAGQELVVAIRAIMRGRTYVDPTLAGVALHEVLRPSPPSQPAREGGPEQLSPRETQVLRDLALGFTNKEVAQRLAVSVKSVETYRARLSEKLGLERRADLVRYAITHNLMSIDDDKAAVDA
jgi:DNA-binding NarL/FixJ family response regulator